jgi:hypothetical protein
MSVNEPKAQFGRWLGQIVQLGFVGGHCEDEVGVVFFA